MNMLEVSIYYALAIAVIDMISVVDAVRRWPQAFASRAKLVGQTVAWSGVLVISCWIVVGYTMHPAKNVPLIAFFHGVWIFPLIAVSSPLLLLGMTVRRAYATRRRVPHPPTTE
jgi:hypothetical protein